MKGKKEGKYRDRVAIRHTATSTLKNDIDGNTEEGISSSIAKLFKRAMVGIIENKK